MSPVKKVTSDNLLYESVFDEAVSDALWVDLVESVESDDFLPEIVNVLGCFCEQTGAQFG
ncbi:MAG: hypothetical protein WA996_02180 [Candidatus Promineifilaceae bacterium]